MSKKPKTKVQITARSKSGDKAQRVTWEQWYPSITEQTASQFPLYLGIDKVVQEVSAAAMKAGGLEEPNLG